MREVKFFPDTHTYTINDHEVISVTQALSRVGMIDKRWYNQHGRDLGLAVHTACLYEDQNDLEEDDLDKEIVPRVRAWRKFKDESGIKIVQAETPLAHPDLPYAGTPDRIVVWKKARAIIDIKNGQKEAWHGLQTMGYALCFDEPMDRYCVYLKPNGRYTLEKYADPSNRAVFLGVLSTAIWMKINMKGPKK